MTPDKKILLLLLLPFSVWAQDSLFKKKVVYDDFIYLNNPYSDSGNPVSMLYNSFDRAQVKLDYTSHWGGFCAKDDPQSEHYYALHLGGNKLFNKMAFEGFFQYADVRQNEKSWNSTLFINKKNPFILCDSFPSDFTIQRFHLNGGVAYKLTPGLQIALKADYQVASSSNQTDPRPKIDAMRIFASAGMDYNWGCYTLGASALVARMSETCHYTAENTYLNYPIFFMHGLAAPNAQQAIGYQRDYSGIAQGVGLQFIVRSNQAANFIELGFSKNSEKAQDGADLQKYKGGNYQSVDFNFNERYTITRLTNVHSFMVAHKYSKVEGITFLQNQQTDQNGNITWLVVNHSICHKQYYNDFALSYRLDKLLVDKTPHFMVKVKSGVCHNQVSHYPEQYEQQISVFYGGLDATKHFYFAKLILSLRADANYAHTMKSKNNVEGSFLDQQYTIPMFDYHSANRMDANLRVDLHSPLHAKSIDAGMGFYAQYGISSAIGAIPFYNKKWRNKIEVGMSLIY